MLLVLFFFIQILILPRQKGVLSHVKPAPSGTAVHLAGVDPPGCSGTVPHRFPAVDSRYPPLEAGNCPVGDPVGLRLAVWLPVRFFRLGYQLEADRLLVTDGVLFPTVRIFPLAALQTAAVSADPLQRLCGLRTLRLTAAGSQLTLPGLTASEAVRLAEVLLEGGDRP